MRKLPYASTEPSELQASPGGRAARDATMSVSLGQADSKGPRALVVEVSGELDIATMGPLRAAALGVVTAAHQRGNRPIQLLLDWERVEFLDSSAVHFLEDICAEGLVRGWTVQLRPPTAPAPARLLQLAVARGWLSRHLVLEPV